MSKLLPQYQPTALQEYRKPIPEWMPPALAIRMTDTRIASVTALERKAGITIGKLKDVYTKGEGLSLSDSLRLLQALGFSLETEEFIILREIPVVKLLN